MKLPIAIGYGFLIGATVILLITILAIMPASQSDQFIKDCRTMAHGRVSNGLCVKGNTILFHQ